MYLLESEFQPEISVYLFWIAQPIFQEQTKFCQPEGVTLGLISQTEIYFRSFLLKIYINRVNIQIII